MSLWDISENMSDDMDMDMRLLEYEPEPMPNAENEVSGLICLTPSLVFESKICGVTAYL